MADIKKMDSLIAAAMNGTTKVSDVEMRLGPLTPEEIAFFGEMVEAKKQGIVYAPTGEVGVDGAD